jgi:L-arabinose isomerase
MRRPSASENAIVVMAEYVTGTVSGGQAMRPRVALIEPYWDFWEASVAFDLRADRAALGAAVRAALPVAWVKPEEADAALVLQTMATPPAWTLPVLGDLPVVVWAAHGEGASPDAAFDHGAITAQGATVGAPMLTSLLVREGRPFELVLGRVDDAAAQSEVVAALAGAAAARRLARARVGRVGAPIAGYDCVDTDGERLRAATGITLVPIEPAELRDLYAAVDAGRVRELERETRGAYDVEVGGEALERSLRAACALDDLVARHDLDAGALNCHVPEIRLGDAIGIAPCFALGRSTTRGVPWACAGDVLTAVAMLAGKLLGGAAQYHELEAVDYASGELVLASSGEFDLALAPAARPRLIANGWYDGAGACACLTAAAGPATLIGFAQVGDGYRLIAAEGAFTGRAFPATGTANGGFTFARGLPAWADWCRAGASHHSSATPGAFGRPLEALGRFLGVESVRV